MSVYRPPGAVYQLDWDPLDNSDSVYAMHPTATTTAGNQLSQDVRCSVRFNQNNFWTQSSDFRGLASSPGLGRSLNSGHRCCCRDLISSDFCMKS